jgi:hypothetical protein
LLLSGFGLLIMLSALISAYGLLMIFLFMFHLFYSPCTYFLHKTGIHDEGSKKRADFCWVISLFL